MTYFIISFVVIILLVLAMSLILKNTVKTIDDKSKSYFVDKLKQYVPDEFNTYYEPFIGGGALLFELSPKKAVINEFDWAIEAGYTLDNPDFQVLYMANVDSTIYNEDGDIIANYKF